MMPSANPAALVHSAQNFRSPSSGGGGGGGDRAHPMHSTLPGCFIRSTYSTYNGYWGFKPGRADLCAALTSWKEE